MVYQVITNLPPPTKVSELRSFRAMASYVLRTISLQISEYYIFEVAATQM